MNVNDPSFGSDAEYHSVAYAYELVVEAVIGQKGDRVSTIHATKTYFDLRCQRVFFSILRCFFFRIFLRRFLTRDPIDSCS
jgi:hypothetical protein